MGIQEDFFQFEKLSLKLNKELEQKYNTSIICANCIFSNVDYSIGKKYFDELYKIADKKNEKEPTEEITKEQAIESKSAIEITYSNLLKQQCNHITRITNKYPYIVFGNLMLIIPLLFVILWWLVEEIILTYYKIIIVNVNYLFIGLGLFVTMSFSIIISIFSSAGKPKAILVKEIYILLILIAFFAISLYLLVFSFHFMPI